MGLRSVVPMREVSKFCESSVFANEIHGTEAEISSSGVLGKQRMILSAMKIGEAMERLCKHRNRTYALSLQLGMATSFHTWIITLVFAKYHRERPRAGQTRRTRNMMPSLLSALSVGHLLRRGWYYELIPATVPITMLAGALEGLRIFRLVHIRADIHHGLTIRMDKMDQENRHSGLRRCVMGNSLFRLLSHINQPRLFGLVDYDVS
jgi:hypothetical protein